MAHLWKKISLLVFISIMTFYSRSKDDIVINLTYPQTQTNDSGKDDGSSGGSGGSDNNGGS